MNSLPLQLILTIMYRNKLSQKFSTSIWFEESINDLKNDPTFSATDIQTTITEGILEYFNENITFKQLLELNKFIKQTKQELLTPFLEEILDKISSLAGYIETEDENSERIYIVLNDALKKVTVK